MNQPTTYETTVGHETVTIDGVYNKDLTEYAQAIGYKGSKRVIVQDGKVISHGRQCWLRFCDSMRKKSIKNRFPDGIVNQHFTNRS